MASTSTIHDGTQRPSSARCREDRPSSARSLNRRFRPRRPRRGPALARSDQHTSCSPRPRGLGRTHIHPAPAEFLLSRLIPRLQMSQLTAFAIARHPHVPSMTRIAKASSSRSDRQVSRSAAEPISPRQIPRPDFQRKPSVQRSTWPPGVKVGFSLPARPAGLPA